MKGNLIIGGIILAAIGIGMGVTNPKPEAYTEYMSEKLLAQGENFLCKETKACNQNAPVILQSAVTLFKGKIARPAIERVIEQSTTHQNLLLFSLYNTEVPDVGSIKTIGIFNHFFTYSKSSS